MNSFPSLLLPSLQPQLPRWQHHHRHKHHSFLYLANNILTSGGVFGGFLRRFCEVTRGFLFGRLGYVTNQFIWVLELISICMVVNLILVAVVVVVVRGLNKLICFSVLCFDFSEAMHIQQLLKLVTYKTVRCCNHV
ncbi:hypothetical protein Vretimale_15308 [Volvox reticuliferus]|uniref:Transmembrane protein n=1 Tax=Volvox reticuliferus TaxID=1737510 RepID=A0A8J4GRN0_9CHLO|nr:hypothetical protein Vretimale_15308 [Volvox reticuliferus]